MRCVTTRVRCLRTLVRCVTFEECTSRTYPCLRSTLALLYTQLHADELTDIMQVWLIESDVLCR